METLTELFIEAIGGIMLRFLHASERLYWPYLLGALFIAAFVWSRRRSDTAGGGGGRNLLRHLFPARIWAHPSAWLDFRFFFLNTILMSVLFLPLIIAVGEVVAGWVEAAPGAPAGGSMLWPAGATIAAVLALDFAVFCCHTAMHKFGPLWEFHKVHHSAEVLVPFTLYRMHPLEITATAMVATAAVTLVLAALSALAGGRVEAATVLGANGIVFAYYLLGYNLRHSHIRLNYPRWLSHILVSPAQHQIHHSRERRHLDKNMGLIFAFWDWGAGSLYVPEDEERFALGLSGGESAEYQTIAALFLLPFKKAWFRLLPGAKR